MPWQDEIAAELEKKEQCDPQQVLSLLKPHENQGPDWIFLLIESLTTSSFIKLQEIRRELQQQKPDPSAHLLLPKDCRDYLPFAEKNKKNPGILLFIQILVLCEYFSKKSANETHIARREHFLRTLDALKTEQASASLISLKAEATQFQHGVTSKYTTQIQALIDTAIKTDVESKTTEGSPTLAEIAQKYDTLFEREMQEMDIKYVYGNSNAFIKKLKAALFIADITRTQAICDWRWGSELWDGEEHAKLSPKELRIPGEVKEHNTKHPEIAILVALYQTSYYARLKVGPCPVRGDKALKKWENFVEICKSLQLYTKGDAKGLERLNAAFERANTEWSKGIGGMLSAGMFGQQTQHYLDLIHTLEWTIRGPSQERGTILPPETIALAIDPFMLVIKPADDKIKKSITSRLSIFAEVFVASLRGIPGQPMFP